MHREEREGDEERLPAQPLPDTELPEAPPDAEDFVADDAAVVRGTPGEAGSEVAHRPPSPGEPFPGGGDMADAEVERDLEDL
ncbi:MAG: hypothetical protein IBX62_06710 [Coriobacteriia bacterium]|nr:hypothetical protein [Coriobacteriia bacterium]